MLLSAARAAVLLESIAGGSPELPLTLAAGVKALASRFPTTRATAEEALGHYRAFAETRAAPPAPALEAMRELVLALPAYVRR